ncbi:hypothetical protein BaRGS_00016540, partial [Batillaria attramentaria]
MASANNIPRDIQDSIRDVLDRRIKISIKRMVKQEVRPDKTENRVLAFSPCRLFVLAAKVPSRIEHSFHFLDIQALESKKINQLALTVDQKLYTFSTLDPNTEEVNHMITHIGVALKQIFPAFPLERLIVKVEVIPPDRLRVMNDMIRGVESREVGPCGGFTTQYACMCDYHSLPYREEVAWDVDTIYLSQDARELCLRDFDHLSAKDQVPIISALEHNSWFTSLNAGSVKLTTEAGNEILKVMRRNAVIEELNLANTGVKTDFVTKLSTALLSNSGTQLSSLDLSGNLIEDRGVTHLFGTLKSLARGLSYLDLSRTGVTTRCLSKMAETLSQSETLLASLQTLKLADNGQKGEDMGSMYQFLAKPNVLTTLDLSGTDCAMDMLCSPLLMGCPHLATLNLARTVFTHKRTKDVSVPGMWKQYFASTCSLKALDLSGTRLPPEAVKELLLGVASNRHVKGLELDLSSNELGSAGAQTIAGCIGNITGIGRLDISNNNFDMDLRTLLPEIAKNRELKHLAIGRNFSSVKPKHMWAVLEYVVQVLQEEESGLESLSLADSKLKQDTACVINALGSNTSLREIDLSGNQMGDYGARMLSKALQINTHLHTVVWDKNAITAQGFEDIAEALEKNYTLAKMPFLLQPERTEAALQKVERLLQRNHSPRKLASDQQYRLQQGFLISSTQQMVDRLCVQVQDSVNALNMGNTDMISDDLQHADKVVKDADNSKQLLPKLQVIAMQAQNPGNTVETTLQTMADNLRSVMEETMQKTVEDMLKCTATHCEGIMSDKAFKTEVESGCKSRSALQKDFTKLVLDGVATDVYNKLSELNLAVAAYISDNVIDEVINKLSESHKGLTNHLNLRKSSKHRDSAVSRDQPEKADAEKDESSEAELRLRTSSGGGSPKLSSKRKSVISRKLRPQSVIDRDALKVHASGSEVMSEDPVYQNQLTMYSDSDELEDSDRKKAGRLEKVAESRSKESSTEHLDELPDLPQVQKLEHLNKARPRRARTHAPKRPVAPGITATGEEADDGINMFYAPPPVAALSEHTGRDSPKDRGSPSTKTEESGTSKAESPKATRPDSAVPLKPTPSVTTAVDTKVVADSPKVLLAPRASEESLDDDLDKAEVKPPRSPARGEAEVKLRSPGHGEVKRADSGREEEEKQKLARQDAKSSSEDDWEKVEIEDATEAASEAAASAEPETHEEKAEEPTRRMPKALPKVGGFGANIMADLRAKQEKRFSQALSSPKPRPQKPRYCHPKKTRQQKEMPQKWRYCHPKRTIRQKGEPQKQPTAPKKDHPAEGGAAKAALLPPKKDSPPEGGATKTAVLPPKKDSPPEGGATKTAVLPPKKDSPPEGGATKTAVLPPKKDQSPVEASAAAKPSLLAALKPPAGDNNSVPKPAPRAQLGQKKPLESVSAGDAGKPAAGGTESSSSAGSAAVPKPRPTPPVKPKPPVTAPKPRPSSKRDSATEDESGKTASAGEEKSTEGEIVYDSSTLRLSVKDKIKRLSQVKFEPPSSAAQPQKKAASLPRDA